MAQIPGTSIEEFVGDLFPNFEIPDSLAASLLRHRENLARMIANLRLAGMKDDQIESNVTILVESYRQELVTAIKAMLR